MQILRSLAARRAASEARRGAVLMISFLVLIILFVVVRQVFLAADSDAKVARNSIGTTQMDLAIESALLEVYDRLALDGEDTGGEAGPTDSRKDDWAQVQRTEIGRVELRVLVQDESSKFNVLSILTEDEDEAAKALERLERILDFYRGGTEFDLDSNEASAMAEAILEHLKERDQSELPRPRLLTDDEEDEDDVGLPLTLREFVVLESFEEMHFREFRDEDDNVIHGLSAFLTVSTSLSTRESYESAEEAEPGANPGGGGQADPQGDAGDPSAANPGETPAGGTNADDGPARAGQSQGQGEATADGSSGPAPATEVGVVLNLNTTPAAVLKALFDDRDVPYSFWDEVIEFRNTEEEDENGEEVEPTYDQYGAEIPNYQIFDSAEKLTELGGWTSIEPIVQTEIESMFGVQSEVFSIYVTARVVTGQDDGGYMDWEDPESVREMEDSGKAMMRTVRSLVWRRQGSDGVEIVPIERWELIDFIPFEVLDYPDDER